LDATISCTPPINCSKSSPFNFVRSRRCSVASPYQNSQSIRGFSCGHNPHRLDFSHAESWPRVCRSSPECPCVRYKDVIRARGFIFTPAYSLQVIARLTVHLPFDLPSPALDQPHASPGAPPPPPSPLPHDAWRYPPPLPGSVKIAPGLVFEVALSDESMPTLTQRDLDRYFSAGTESRSSLQPPNPPSVGWLGGPRPRSQRQLEFPQLCHHRINGN